ncbi:MAG TPA: mannose-1-phosphate guanylyltransferase, partial [Pirellulales bacterium]|nr:mannose-1-phosphate guanylyltransferase [Pirellulales bacterium]
MLHAVIMAGGSGTRFWPESRADRPKQLLALTGPRSMIQETIDRLGSLVPPERTLVVTAARLEKAMRRQLPNLPSGAIIGEPCKRDTAPCIGLAAFRVSRDDPDATLVVMPADHVISPADAFQQAIVQAARLVEQAPDRIVTFGIRPTYPAESFGYIERGAALDEPGTFAVARFREKPPLSIAKEYLAAGNFYWNSGIFIWKARTILEALERHEPEMHGHLRTIAAAERTADFAAVFAREFAAIRGVSIDYAVMEKARNVAVIEAPFEWDDVGSWHAIARLRGVDAQGNTICG